MVAHNDHHLAAVPLAPQQNGTVGPMPCQEQITGAVITLKGVVQGVGFRPFVHRLARECGLMGTVRNFSGGVIIEVEGPKERVAEFYRRVSQEAPPLARVVTKHRETKSPQGLKSFSVQESTRGDVQDVLVPPDMAVCSRCLGEMADPTDRRYQYPFINCTDCGPRFTIIEDMPYDRPKTTMRSFTMCPSCRREYLCIEDRRYHAQPNACPQCGPQLTFGDAGGAVWHRQEAIQEAIRRLRSGNILAVRGIGGFHLCCDADDDRAVDRLRRRKHRPVKPLAIMSRDLATVRRCCHLSAAEERLLVSPMRPIVILRRRTEAPVSPLVAPGSDTLGVMLPYAPVQEMLLSQGPAVMVATSANLSDQPLIADNDQARQHLSGIADGFLLHDRDIRARCDDSIFRVVDGQPMPIRRARGYVPMPVQLPFEMPALLACGGELKNTFAIARKDCVFLSQHIGDLKNIETFSFFKEMVDHFEHLFGHRPRILAHDLHPQYLSTRYAQERRSAAGSSLETLAVQHHHAHVAACMADNGVVDPVIGVVFDGLGHGLDGHVWGAELLVADYGGFRRSGHLRYVHMPGGDQASRQPWRMALSYLFDRFGERLDPWVRSLKGRIDGAQIDGVIGMLRRNFNSPLASSMGRLFDAIASLVGICDENTFEGQAAMSLEIAAASVAGPLAGYPWSLQEKRGVLTVDPRPLIDQVLIELRRGVPGEQIAWRFHRSVAELVVVCAERMRKQFGLGRVALSGGVFQNKLLSEMTVELLRSARFEPLVHHQVPANDGGLSLGQAAIAGWKKGGRASCV